MARVLPAGDIPAQLLGSTASTSPHARAQAAVWDDAAHAAQRSNSQPPSPGRQRYGAWYVPPDQWATVYRADGPEAAGGPQGAHLPSHRPAQGSREADVQAALNTSYAAKAYKDHLRQKHLPEPAALARLLPAGDPTHSGSPRNTTRPDPSNTRTTQSSLQHSGGVRGTSTAVGMSPGNGPSSNLRKTNLSPFQDMELDEIISPDMRAAVRKTLAMNQMMAEHAAKMRKYYATRRKAQALAAALKARGLQPRTPGGHTTLDVDFLMAASPSAVQSLLTPHTGAQVGALVAAAQHLTTDGTLEDVQFVPDSPAPVLRLPRHIAASRSVKFSDAKAPESGGDPTTDGLQGVDGHEEEAGGLEDLTDPAWTEDMDTVEAGTQQQGQDVSHPPDHIRPVPSLDLSLPKQLTQAEMSAPAACAAGAPHTEQWIPRAHVRDTLTHSRPRRHTLPASVPSIALPSPAPDSLPSDRSLTPSLVLQQVPSTVFTPRAQDPLDYLLLSAQVQAQEQVTAQLGHIAWPAPYPSPFACCQSETQASMGRATTLSAAPQSNRQPHTGTRAGPPLGMHVLGCMVAKAKGHIDRVALLPEYRPMHSPAVTDPVALPWSSAVGLTSPPQQQTPDPPAPSAQAPGVQHRRTTSPLIPQADIDLAEVPGDLDHDPAHVFRPRAPAPDHSLLPSVMMGLMNLSLTYLAGDRVPKPGSKPTLPLEARGMFSTLSTPGLCAGRSAGGALECVPVMRESHSAACTRDSHCVSDGGMSDWLRRRQNLGPKAAGDPPKWRTPGSAGELGGAVLPPVFKSKAVARH